MKKEKNEKVVEDTIAAECVAVRLRMLNRVVTRIYDDALRPLGVRASQLNILVATAKLVVARPAELCGRLQIETSTLSRNIERMKSNGWMEVVPDDDGRAQPVRLTRKGRRLLDQVKPMWDDAQNQVKTLLGKRTLDSIDEAVRRIKSRKL